MFLSQGASPPLRPDTAKPGEGNRFTCFLKGTIGGYFTLCCLKSKLRYLKTIAHYVLGLLKVNLIFVNVLVTKFIGFEWFSSVLSSLTISDFSELRIFRNTYRVVEQECLVFLSCASWY